MTEPSGPDLVGAELLDVVVRLNRWVTRHTDWPLPVAQARVLSQIDEMRTTRVSDLARAQHCSQPTMTSQVRRLQDQGLIARTPDPDDARAAWISLTNDGRRTLAGIRRARADIIESLIRRLAPADRQRLQGALDALTGLLAAAYRQTPLQQEQSGS
jgi:DNA-binding MarR family transcriptional regulator